MLLLPVPSKHDDFDPFAGPPIAVSCPSTEAQREIWTATRMGDDASLAFNESVSLHLTGVLDDERLAVALRALTARHESLRATFSDDGMTMIVLEVAAELPLEVVNWSASADSAAMLDALRVRVVTEPFDLASGPLIRFVLVQLAENDHVLLVTAHHIICDGWSIGVVARELAALYNSAGADGSGLAPAPRMSDYARTTREGEALEATAEAERYWMGRFEGELPVLDLPTDRMRPPARSYVAEREDHVLPADLVRGVVATGGKSGASLFVTLFAAFGVLLRRVSGQGDLVIGVPAAGQSAAGVPGLVGHLVSLLPIRVRIDTERTFRDIAGDARSSVLDAYDHQSLTFGSLLRQLPTTRDAGRPPLVSVAFNLDRSIAPSAMSFQGLRATLTSNPRRFENFDLFLNAVDLDGEVTLECQYNSDLLDGATVRAWLSAYENLLRAVVAQPDEPVGRLALVSGAQLQSLVGGEDLRPLPPWATTVHALVEAQVQRTPDAVAVDFEGDRLTYRELDARANRLARHLKTLGVRRGALVGLCVERSLELFVGVLGILKAGGAYVPLDPGYPLDRLAFMGSDAAMSVLVTEARVHEVTPLTADQVVLLDTHAGAIALMDDSPLPAGDGATPESPAYVIYTSGSTGRPNGVVVPHRAVVNLLLSVQQTPGLSARDVVLAITTLSFDIAVSEIILPLTVGARIVLASRDVASDGVRLRHVIESSGVTFIDATPATYRLLFAAGWAGGTSLRVICTGEAMPRDLAETLCGAVGEVWNGYGPTETTVWSTFWRVRAPVERILIGRPVANTTVYVLDEHQQPVPVGVKGQLFIGGSGVTHGYLGRPELTSARFVADPFATDPEARMYRTGDVVRFLADGDLEYLGRSDNQVKIRGYRIELGEIEDALGHIAGVHQVAVVARSDRPGDVRLVAYVVTSGDAPPTSGAMRAQLQRTLPDYMVPSIFVALATMPLSPSGKIDRKALPSPNADAQVRDDAFIEARTDAERIVAALWREALGVGRVSVRDNFFTLGGHSLLASQVLARLRRDHGVTLSFRKFFEAPTIEGFAELVDRERSSVTSAGATHILPRTVPGPAPLSVIQERLWLLEELEPAQRVTHNLPAAWRLRGAIDAARLERVLNDIVARHEMLRTSFRVTRGAPQQVVSHDVAIALPQLDLSAHPEDERERLLNEYMLADQERDFDVTVAPLFRAALIRVGTDEHVLYTLRHSMVWDGWSFDLFIRELAQRYAALTGGTPYTPPDLPITYGDFAAFQRDWLQSAEALDQVAWWRSHLSGDLPVLEFPTDRPRAARSDYRGDRSYLTFAPDEVERLRVFARGHDATLFTVMFAAFNVLLHRWTGQSDLLIGTPARARTWAETEHVVGPFVNMLVLRTQLTPAMSFLSLLGQVRDNALSALSRSEIPFESIGERPPVIRAIFSMQDARTRPLSAGGLSINQVPEPQRYAANDLMLWMMETPVGLRAVLNYSCALFDVETVERILGHLRTLVFSIIDDPTRAVADLAMLAADELALVSGESAAEEPRQVPRVAELLGEVQRSRADAVAVATNEEELTYAALDQRARPIADILEALGAPSDHRVAICLERGPTAIATMQASFRAGSAVTLLDPHDAGAYNKAVLRHGSFDVLVTDPASARELADAVRHVVVVRPDGSAQLQSSVAGVTMVDPGGDAGVAAIFLHAPTASGEPAAHRVSPATLDAWVEGLQREIALSSSDVGVSVLPQGSTVAIVEQLLALSRGARLVLAGDDESSDGAAVAGLMRRAGATFGIAPLDVWQSVAARPDRPPAGFRAVVIDPMPGSADLSALVDAGWHVVVPAVHPERGTWFAMNHVRGSGETTRIGEPFPGTGLVVVDERMRPVPLGVWGALHLAGPLAADADASATGDTPRTIEAPGRSSRLFPSGSRARRHADGTVEVRADAGTTTGQVETSAIESVMARHPGVAWVHVRRELPSGGPPRLVAYVVSRRGSESTDSELRAFVRAALPRRTVPSLVVDIHEPPIDASGRLEPDRLPSPFEAGVRAATHVAPRTDAEQSMARIWGELLGTDSVGIADNFFSRGGYSLLCFRAIDRIERESGVRLSPRVLLLGTLEQAAAQVALAADGRSVDETPLAGVATNDSESADRRGVFRRFKDLLGGAR